MAKTAPKTAAKAAPKASRKAATKKPAPKKAAPKAKLLAGGNPQVAKGEGDGPVQAYIAAVPAGWKQDVCRKVDALITRTVPGARKAVKWNSPFYGAIAPDTGWFLSFHCFSKYVKVAFFKGAQLKPLPPGASSSDAVRYLDIYENDEIDEKQLAAWIKQAAKLPGWLS
jgi:hypothetical protein